MKRVLASILSLIMLFSAVGVVAAEGDICKIGDVGYPTLNAAVEAITDDTQTTIVLTSSAQGAGVVIPSGRNIVLDLGEKTYDIVAPTVGSEGTKTSGFQLLKDSTITIKNGTITSEAAKFLIQNYANLTLDGVTLDGSMLAESENSPNYTLSNNCGNIVINNSTIIADTDGEYTDFAFDVCDYASYSGVKVTVTGDSKIDGKIEITDPNGGDKKPELVVEGGSFTDIATAIENAKSGATIKLLKATSDNGIKVASGKNFTLDLGGNTYTVVAPTVGSEGTKTSGFQLLKDSTITIANGTIKSEEAKFLIQNYANLTLDGVTLDGSKLAESESSPNYTLSNNCGDITIKDSTIIADEDEADFAFDVCDYASYSGVKVTVTGESAINGAFEVTNPNGGENNAKLIIDGGKFTKDPSAYIAKGYARTEIKDETYKYSVVELETDAQPLLPETNASAAEGVDEEIAEEIITNAGNAAISGIDSVVNDIANDVDADEAKDKLVTEEIIAADSEAEINVFVQPSLDVTVTEVKVEDDKPVITLDIKATSQVIATTASNAEGIITGDEGKNAVVLEEKPLETKGQDVVITVPVPQSVVDLGAVMVKHTKTDGKVYYYPATIDTVNKTITFVNPNGFSEFEISEAAQPLTIDFGTNKDKAGNPIEDIALTIYDIGTKLDLKDAYKKSHRFDGWSFGEDKKEYKGKVELTEKLWAVLSEEATEGVVNASANFTKEDSDRETGTSTGIYVTYKIQFNSAGGTDVKDATVARGASLTEPQAPTKGELVFGGWYTDRSYSVEYDFSKPVYSSFTLYAKWESAEGTAVIFDDVIENDWFFDVVNEAYEKGLMNGMGDGEFAPAAEVTRGMFVTVLYRIAGEPAVSEAAAFDDVAADKYYANAVAWATANGITNGMSETEFMPERSISREQMATILYRYAEAAGEDVSIGDTLSFSDAESINDYAVSAIEWACAAGLMNGYPEGTFAPQNTATRAEAAAVLVRMAK